MEGERISEVTFRCRVRDGKDPGENPFTWKDVTTYDLFKGRRIVLFALPGAFTPTCSNTHLPDYERLYSEIRSEGIDDIFCLSVNDAFVMRQWGIHQNLSEEKCDPSCQLNPGNFQNVKLIPDGVAHFTKSMDMQCTWDENRGFGCRSWRYSCVIDDLIIEKLFIEGDEVTQNSVDDPFSVSSAQSMLEFLKSNKRSKVK